MKLKRIKRNTNKKYNKPVKCNYGTITLKKLNK